MTSQTLTQSQMFDAADTILAAEDRAGERSRRRRRRRRRADPRCASNSTRRSSTRPASRWSRRRNAHRVDQREPSQGHPRRRRARVAALCERPVEDRGRVPAADRRLPERRRGAARRHRDGGRFEPGPSQRRPRQRQARRGADHLSGSRTPTSSRRSTASRRCCRSPRRRSRRPSTSRSCATARRRSARRFATTKTTLIAVGRCW